MAISKGGAVIKLQAILGPKFAYEVRKGNCADEREAAKASLPELKQKAKDAEEAANKRRRELLADPEYLRLFQEMKDARKARDTALWKSGRYKITVGTNEGIGFFVKAEGDTWDEVVSKVQEGAA